MCHRSMAQVFDKDLRAAARERFAVDVTAAATKLAKKIFARLRE